MGRQDHWEDAFRTAGVWLHLRHGVDILCMVASVVQARWPQQQHSTTHQPIPNHERAGRAGRADQSGPGQHDIMDWPSALFRYASIESINSSPWLGIIRYFGQIL